jgi:hypothetical protein
MEEDKVAALRALIDEHLRSQNVYQDIRAFVSDFATQDGGVGGTDQDVIDALKEKGMVDAIITSFDR